MSTAAAPQPQSGKSPLDAALKIVAELGGMSKEDQALAVRFAVETLRLAVPLTSVSSTSATTSPVTVPSTSGSVQGISAATPGQPMDIRSFTLAKGPKSDQQFAAVVAYYYQFEAPPSQRKDTIDTATMKEAARQAGRPQAPDWKSILNNTVRAGYLNRAERGAFSLNAVGENLVAITLPGNGGAPAGVGAARRKSSKNASSNARSKKPR